MVIQKLKLIVLVDNIESKMLPSLTKIVQFVNVSQDIRLRLFLRVFRLLPSALSQAFMLQSNQAAHVRSSAVIGRHHKILT